MDGVLLHSYDAWFALVNHVARVAGMSPISPESFAEGWGQGIAVDVEVWFPGMTIRELEALYAAHFTEHLEHVAVEPDAAACFARIRAAGLPIAVITNTPRVMAEPLLAHAGLVPDTLVGGTDIEHAKPAPDMVLLACERLGVDPATSVVIGDSIYDGQAAAAAGAGFVRVGPDFSTLADAVAEALAGI